MPKGSPPSPHVPSSGGGGHDDDGDRDPYERPPESPTVDQGRIRRAVREILLAVGEDPDREGLLETPDRVARMYAEVFRGLHEDPRVHLRKLFTQKYDEMVVVKDIQFASFCEHHLLPFTGKAHVGYLPNGKVVGLSKIPRVIDTLSRRPQVQERLTEDLADLLNAELGARGVAVVIEASHSCMTVRGVLKPGSTCITSALRAPSATSPRRARKSSRTCTAHGIDRPRSRRAAALTIPLPAEFALRMSGGLAALLLVAPRRAVPPAFFRTHCLVILGLLVLAALSLKTAAPAATDAFWTAVGLATLAYLASACWGLGVERLALPLTAALAGSALIPQALIGGGETAWGWPRVQDAASGLASAALLGSTLSAMLLGHHYLTAPAMSIEPLRRFVRCMAWALGIRSTLAAAGLATWAASHPWRGSDTALLLAVRWGMGVAGPALATFMTRETVKIRSTQSATGILYIAMTLVLFGELSAMVLSRGAGVQF